jgi:hypothetical protein
MDTTTTAPTVWISYDPSTGTTTLDDRWTDHDGVTHGAAGVYPEPYGPEGVAATVMLFQAAGRTVVQQ